MKTHQALVQPSSLHRLPEPEVYKLSECYAALQDCSQLAEVQ